MQKSKTISYKCSKLAGNSGNVEWIVLYLASLLSYIECRQDTIQNGRTAHLQKCKSAKSVEGGCKRAG
jgi:hypothetical protein